MTRFFILLGGLLGLAAITTLALTAAAGQLGRDPVYTVETVQAGLMRHTEQWLGRTVLIRGTADGLWAGAVEPFVMWGVAAMRARAVSGEPWGAAARDWVELREPTTMPLWEAMLTAAGVGSGTRLLDAGCGAGGASALAAGRGAHVNGLDLAPALLAIARERVPDGDFRFGDLAALPYADGTFDAVITADVLSYAADTLAALRELCRVCALHGRVVVAVMSPPEACALHAILAAVGQIMPEPLEGDTFALSAPGVLDTLLARAGLKPCGEGSVACPAEYLDREIAWRALAAAGPLQAALRKVGERQLKAAVLAALTPYGTAAGGVHLVNHFRYVTTVPDGDRPGRCA